MKQLADNIISKCHKLYSDAKQAASLGNKKSVCLNLIEIMENLSYLIESNNPYCDKEDIKRTVKVLLELCKDIREHGLIEKTLNKLGIFQPSVQTDKGTCVAEEEIIGDNKEENNIRDTNEEIVLQNNNELLRPQKLNDYVGQTQIKRAVQESIIAAKQRNDCLEHIMLYGPAGLGKTTLARIIANEMGADIIIINAPTIKDANNFIEIILKIKENDILFIDEIHRINKAAAEAIYTALESFSVSYLKKSENGVENVVLNLPKFTAIAATTHSGLLEKPLRDRFVFQYKLRYYTVNELSELIKKSVKKLKNAQNGYGFEIEENAVLDIANRSKGVPRLTNRYIKGIRDRAQINNLSAITQEVVLSYFNDFGIDAKGLDRSDREILEIIIDKYDTGPVGLDTISAIMGESVETIEKQYEPYLMYLGFIKKTAKGRICTEAAKSYFDEYREQNYCNKKDRH